MGSCSSLPESSKYEENVNDAQIVEIMRHHSIKSISLHEKSLDKNAAKLMQCKLEEIEKEIIELRKELIEAKKSKHGTILELQRVKLERDILNERLIENDIINFAYVAMKHHEEEDEDEEETPIPNEITEITESKVGVLSIKVINAINVDNMDNMDPSSYVILELAGNYRTTHTKTIHNEQNPAWNEMFQLLTENPKTDILKCTIWNKNTWKFDREIGYVEIKVIDIINENDGCIQCKGYNICGSKIGCKLYLDIKILS